MKRGGTVGDNEGRKQKTMPKGGEKGHNPKCELRR